MIKSAGIYIHIPYCKQACTYCDFYFSTSLSSKNDFIEALCNELVMQKHLLDSQTKIRSIYFGGGTPGILPLNDIEKILITVYENYEVNDNAEITLETNPDDVSLDKVLGWKNLKINRISLGVQSFVEEHLKMMKRSHDSKKALEAIQMIKDHFSLYTVDLIFGIPGLSETQWIENLATLTSFDPPHISVYSLTIEPKTVLHFQINKGKILELPEEESIKQFNIAIDYLNAKGYIQYEISNYAKNGSEAIHNSAYWRGETCLGFGPSAVGFISPYRYQNISNTYKYIEKIENNELPINFEETLSQTDIINEKIMTNLRMSDGLDLNSFEETIKNELIFKIQKWIENDCLILQNNTAKLTIKGKIISNTIISEIFS